MWAPAFAELPDGRPHFQHGPIDLVLSADGAADEVAAAYAQARARFPDILPTLVEELALLRSPVGETPHGPVAQRMRWACLPYADLAHVTPMAAVAGAVADEMLAAMIAGRRLDRAYVNDGGDIALYLGPGATFTAGLVADDETAEAAGTVTLDAASPVRGIATSGRGGRSHSLGIADSVTVLADRAADADAAATLIANAVDADHPAIERAPASELDPDSDLGARPVTVAVGALPAAVVDAALDAGLAAAERYLGLGLIHGAALSLRGARRVAGAARPGSETDESVRSIPA